MNKAIILGVLIFTIVCSCSSKKEFNNKEFQLNYQNCIQIILLKNRGCEIEFYDLAKAYDVLECLTETPSKVNKGSDVPYYYQDTKHLNDDLDIWFQWLNGKGNRYTMAKAENIFQKKNATKTRINNDSLRKKRKELLGVSDQEMQKIEDLDFVTWPELLIAPDCKM